MYGSLISPLIVLKAFLYAFPSARLEKVFGERNYAMTGIQLREDPLVESHPVGQDLAGFTVYPRLREIAFDKEAVSPCVLEGMEMPVWKVVEESQELISLNEIAGVPAFEDCKMLGSPELTSSRSLSLDPITPNQDCGGILSLPRLDVLLVESAQVETSAQWTIDRSPASEPRSEYDKAASSNSRQSPILSDPHIECGTIDPIASTTSSLLSVAATSDKSACTSSQALVETLQASARSTRLEILENTSLKDRTSANTTLEHNEGDSTSASHGELADESRFRESQKSYAHVSSGDKFDDAEAAGKMQESEKGFKTPACGTGQDRGSLDRNAPFTLEAEPTTQVTRSRSKRSRQLSPQPSVPVKKMKPGDDLSSRDVTVEDNSYVEGVIDLDGDTIVVEAGYLPRHAGHARAINAKTGAKSQGVLPTLQSRGAVKAVESPRLARHQEPPREKLSEPRIIKTKSCRQYSGDPPCVVFSSTTEINAEKNVMAFLRDRGGKLVKNVAAATILCIGSNQPLKKSANLVLAVCMGLDIVTDKWLVESQRKGFLLHPQDYLPQDPQREREWKFKLDEAIARGRKRGALTGLLTGTNVHFTRGLKSLLAHNFRDFTKVATCLGADAVKTGLPNGKEEKDILILGTTDDPQTLRASHSGYEVWSKDLLVMGALRGSIQRVDEFIVAKPMKEEINLGE